MKNRFLAACCAVAGAAAPAFAAPVSFDWVTVGDAGNPAHSTGFGAVGYEYRIAKHEVTNAQYGAFLNAVDPNGTDTRNLYAAGIMNSGRGGIVRDTSNATGSKYELKTDFVNKPVIGVSFNSAMRFVNWLDNGQGAGGTETGVYTITDGVSETRAANASYYIPNEDEWVKAAYYEPGASGDGYWEYATQSDSTPTAATATATGDIANPGSNVVNYNQTADWFGQTSGNVTTVGSADDPNTTAIESASHYGTFDQSGNVWEWTEKLNDSDQRSVRGGSFADTWQGQLRVDRTIPHSDPDLQNQFRGFRVAAVIPEPGSIALLSVGAALMLSRSVRQRKA